VTTNPFFVPTQYGIQDACSLLGCDFQWTGSANADVAEMVNALNAALAAKASAIAVPSVDPHAFDAPVERALNAGIPVFAYNADAPANGDNKRLAYIGQDLY
jgi:simple sugar transport system substrate-binding protein